MSGGPCRLSALQQQARWQMMGGWTRKERERLACLGSEILGREKVGAVEAGAVAGEVGALALRRDSRVALAVDVGEDLVGHRGAEVALRVVGWQVDVGHYGDDVGRVGTHADAPAAVCGEGGGRGRLSWSAGPCRRVATLP